jgi:phosphatidylserine/phosphatidylglycerophosphate/cardiolipin synthase-like enzyme
VKPRNLNIYTLVFSVLVAGMAGGCASKPISFPAQESYVLQDTDQTPMGLAAREFSDSSEGLSGIFPLYLGLKAFDVRSDMIRHAQASIDIQVFLYHDDLVGRPPALQLSIVPLAVTWIGTWHRLS